jgi:hypothetical protein
MNFGVNAKCKLNENIFDNFGNCCLKLDEETSREAQAL